MKNIIKHSLIILIMIFSIYCSYTVLNLVFVNRFHIDNNNLLYKFLSIEKSKFFYNIVTVFTPLISAIIATQLIIFSISKMINKNLTDIRKKVLHLQLVLVTLQFFMLIFTENQFNTLIAVASCYILIDNYYNKLTK